MAAAKFELKIRRLFEAVLFYKEANLSLKHQRDHFKKGMILYKEKYLKQRRIINRIKTMGSATRNKTGLTTDPKRKSLMKSVNIIESAHVNCPDKDTIGLLTEDKKEIEPNPKHVSNKTPVHQKNAIHKETRKRKLSDISASDTEHLIESPSKRVCINRRTVELLEKHSEIETPQNQSIQGGSDIDDMDSGSDAYSDTESEGNEFEDGDAEWLPPTPKNKRKESEKSVNKSRNGNWKKSTYTPGCDLYCIYPDCYNSGITCFTHAPWIAHMKGVHGNKHPYLCFECYNWFKSKKDLDEHSCG